MSQSPSGKALINSILATLSTAIPDPNPTNETTLTTPSIQRFLSSPQIKQLLLTLHCIFPDHLLPALDLLERQKITRQILKPRDNTADQTQHGSGEKAAQALAEATSCYYAEASAPRSNRYSQVPAAAPNYYEVRLGAWSCSCPAFTFAAMEGELEEDQVGETGDGSEHGIRYGGMAKGDRHPPMCKHLMACFLAQSSPILRSGVKVVERTQQEMAAWAAGWIT